MNSKLLRVILPLALFVLVTGCQKNSVEDEGGNEEIKGLVKDFDYSTVWEWNELFVRIDKDAMGFRPTPGPRAMAYMGLSAYETAIPGMTEYNSLKNQWGSELKIPDFVVGQEIHWPTAVNSSYAYLMKKFFFKA